MRPREPGDDDFYSRESETQRLLVRDQDSTLRHLSSSVDRVQGIAIRVNEEIRDQNRMLDDIDDELDKTAGRLAGMHAQLRRIANDKDRGKYCVIFCLLVLLVVLISMVLES